MNDYQYFNDKLSGIRKELNTLRAEVSTTYGHMRDCREHTLRRERIEYLRAIIDALCGALNVADLW